MIDGRRLYAGLVTLTRGFNEPRLVLLQEKLQYTV